MNKVTLNGKIPPKRVNLKNVNTTIWHENFIPEKIKHILLNGDRKIIFIGESLNIWEKEFGKPWTQIGKITNYDFCEMFFIQDEIKYLVTQKSEYPNYNIDILEVFKIENGNITLMSKTTENSLGLKSIAASMYINKEIYIHGQSNTGYKFFKSKDFGLTWTEITNQIVNNTSVNTDSLFHSQNNKININNMIYIFTETDILSFDGKAFNIFKKNANIKWNKNTNDLTNRNSTYILSVEKIFSNSVAAKQEFNFYKLEKNNLGGIDINLDKNFIHYMAAPEFIDTEKLTCYTKERGDETNLCYKEFPVTAYIEVREKG